MSNSHKLISTLAVFATLAFWHPCFAHHTKKPMDYILLGVDATSVKGQIKQQILRNKPNVKNVDRLAHYIHNASIIHDIPWDIFTAILMRESGYRNGVVNDFDFGIAQININNIRSYKLSFHRVLWDIPYSIDAGAMILSWFKKTYSHKTPRWWVGYNCGVKPPSYKTCVKYYTSVKQWL